MRTTISSAAALGLLLLTPPWHACAQSSAIPDTYSFVATSEMMGKMTIKVNRNNSKELVESIGDTIQLRQLYDFQAHRVYTLDLAVNRCTTQEYTSPYAPSTQDPIGSSAEMAAKMGSLPVAGKENVNGIPTKVVEAELAEGRGKYKYWLEEKANFPVKMSLTLTGQPERLLFEMRQLSLAPSPASMFVRPPGCGDTVSGVTSASGGRATAKVEAKAAGTQVLGRAGSTTEAPPTSAAGPAQVTAVRLRVEPASYSGPCPSRVKLVGEITTNGAGTVWYEFLAGAVRKSGPAAGKITFSKAGTQTVTLDAEYIRTPAVPNCSLLAAMAGPDGKKGVQNVSSGPVQFNATCTSVAR